MINAVGLHKQTSYLARMLFLRRPGGSLMSGVVRSLLQMKTTATMTTKAAATGSRVLRLISRACSDVELATLQYAPS